MHTQNNPMQQQQHSDGGVTDGQGYATASLILGICGFFVGITAVLAIIFASVSLSRINKRESNDGKGMAVAGLVCGLVSILLWVFWIIILLAAEEESDSYDWDSSSILSALGSLF